MSELIQGLVQVRDGLSLIAFLSLVLLMAFRTQKVPELVFGLVRDKLTRQQFSDLLHRFMTLLFIAFLVLVALVALSQVLNSMTQPSALTIEDLRRELADAQQADDQKLHAEALYRLAMEQLNTRDFEAAIRALKESIAAVPTLTAKEMLAYLFRQTGDLTSESQAWEDAVKTARERGDSLALVRLDRSGAPAGIPDAEGDHDLIGESTPLAKGGEPYDVNAPTLTPGFFGCLTKEPCVGWYKLSLRAGQGLEIKLRSPPFGGLAGVTLFGTNGQSLEQVGDGPNTMRGNAGPGGTIYTLSTTALQTGWYFLVTTADPGTVYRIQVVR